MDENSFGLVAVAFWLDGDARRIVYDDCALQLQDRQVDAITGVHGRTVAIPRLQAACLLTSPREPSALY